MQPSTRPRIASANCHITRRVLGRAEVQAVGHRGRPGAGGRDVPVRLGQRELGAGVRVELGEPPVAVGRHRDAEAAGLVDPDHPAVLGLREHRVAQHVPVVLVRHPGLVAQVRRRDQLQQGVPQLRASGCPRQLLGAVGLQLVLPVRPRVRALVDRALVRDGPRRYVDHPLAVPVDLQPAGVGDLTDHVGLDVPLGADLQERLDVVRRDDRHHPFLRLAHQDLFRRERGVPQRHLVERHVHAAVARAGQLGGRTGQSGATEVLDALDHVRGEQLERALDQQLLHERVADLDRRPLGRAALGEGLATPAPTLRRSRRHRSWRRTG